MYNIKLLRAKFLFVIFDDLAKINILLLKIIENKDETSTNSKLYKYNKIKSFSAIA